MTELDLLKFIGYFIGFIYLLGSITWIFYLAFMNLKNNRDKLHPNLRKLMIPWLIIGILLDFLFDQIIGRLYFRELRHFWLFTSRCQYHLKHSSGIRLRKAKSACRNLLDPFENGNHC